MPQIIIVKRQSVKSEPVDSAKVLIVIDPDKVEIYTDEDAEEKMARDA